MAQRKKTDKEKKTLNIKATTGAWWKSTTTEEPVKKSTRKKSRSSRSKNEQKVRPKKSPQKTAAFPEKIAKKAVESTQPTEAKSQPQPPIGKPNRSARKRTLAQRRRDARKVSGEASWKPAEHLPSDNGESVTDLGTQTAGINDTQPEAGGRTPGAKTGDGKSAAQSKPAAKGKPKRGRRSGKPGANRKAPQTVPDGGATSSEDLDNEVKKSEPGEIDTSVERDQSKSLEVDSSKGGEEPNGKEAAKLCKLLINAEEPEECRLALLEDGRLESIHVSTVSQTQRKNNIYKAKIVALEPSLQAAFVEYGTDKNGFLPFSEIHPEYYKQELSTETQKLVDNHQWKKLRITDVVEKGQEILAQVVKEEVGKKGANMTTFLSIPGRCVVLMPGSDSAGISRKISGEKRRSQLRDTMESIDLPEGIGWIVRTASVDITQEALSRDVKYLLKLWEDIKAKGQALDGVGLVYEDHHSVLRFLREHFDPSFQEILVDDKTALEQVKSFLSMLPEEQQNVKVRLHQGARPIFNQFSVEDQIESIYQPQVNLPSGGSIVIDPTEALVAIDVNSGSTSKGKNFEASIYQANLEAAAELARQLRLRDLGGLIVVDFIDMRSKKHILAVEKQVKAAMKKDKAKVDFTRISKFGLMQISRQKLGAPIEAGNYRRCEHCKGRGSVRSIETLSLFYLRRIQTGASRKAVERIECHFPLDVATYLLNKKRSEISEMENRYHVEITLNGDVEMKPAENEIIFHKVEKEKKTQKQT